MNDQSFNSIWSRLWKQVQQIYTMFIYTSVEKYNKSTLCLYIQVLKSTTNLHYVYIYKCWKVQQIYTMFIYTSVDVNIKNYIHYQITIYDYLANKYSADRNIWIGLMKLSYSAHLRFNEYQITDLELDASCFLMFYK